jgi:6-phospho-3-hexuloisomerase
MAIEEVPHEQIESMIRALIETQERRKKVLVIGMGRSGLVGKAFAMRLMHLGFNVHVVGETITPALGKDDILFAISGSGATTFVVVAAEIAKRVGARVLAVTSYPASPLGRLADYIVYIPGRIEIRGRKDYFSRQILGEHEPLAPLGTLFEISAMIFLDSLIVELMRRLRKTEEEMRARHATIE